MRRVVFKATIFGPNLVSDVGPVRVPSHFRIRLYADGRAVITTRGRLKDVVILREGSTAASIQDVLGRLESLEFGSAFSRHVVPESRWVVPEARKKRGRSFPPRESVESGGSLVFKATISGRDLVRETGPVRRPTYFRIRVYDDGEAVITTMGALKDGADRSEDFGKDPKYSVSSTLKRLSELEKLSRSEVMKRRSRNIADRKTGS